MQIAFDAAHRRHGSLAALAGIASAAPLGLELARAHWGMTTFARPDRVIGWSGDLYALPLALLWAVAAVAVVAFAVSLWRAARSRSARIPLVATATVLALSIAAISSMTMQVATVDTQMYESSVSRGLAAIVVTVAWPLAMALVGSCLWQLGHRIVAILCLVAAGLCGYVAIVVAEIAALNGGHQPQVDSALAVQATAAAWLLASGTIVAVGPRLRPDPFAGRAIVAGLLPAAAACALVVALVPSPGPGAEAIAPVLAAQLSGATQIATFDVAGVERTYRLHLPPQLDPHPALVIVLHPVFGSGFRAEQHFGFDAEADRRGWLVAYPDGVLDGWDAFGSNDYWGRHPGADDIAFLSAMVERIASGHPFDRSKLFVTGFSRGGMMTYRVGCELPQPVAAIAPIAGNMATESGSADVPCQPGHPVSVLATHGTADGTIPLAGGHVDIDYSPLADVIARWRTIDGCAGEPTTDTAGGVTTTVWPCASGSAVGTRIVTDGGHAIPGDSASVIADFFAAHPLASAR